MWRNVEKSVMCRNFPHDRFLHMRNEKCQANLLCGGISPHDRFLHMSNEKCGESVTWRNFFSSTLRLIRISTFFSCILLFCCKICFVAIYAVLSRNLFCCDLRAFVWRKVEPKIVLVEKKRQISGMHKILIQKTSEQRALHPQTDRDGIKCVAM